MAEPTQGASGGTLGELRATMAELEQQQIALMKLNVEHTKKMAPAKEGNGAAKAAKQTT